MKRRFNVTGSCDPRRHYMVDLSERLKKIAGTFADDTAFVKGFANRLLIALKRMEFEDKEKFCRLLAELKDNRSDAGMDELFECLSSICGISSRPVVLMIDEVDGAGNNQVFVDFLAQLRGYYLARQRVQRAGRKTARGVPRLFSQGTESSFGQGIYAEL